MTYQKRQIPTRIEVPATGETSKFTVRFSLYYTANIYYGNGTNIVRSFSCSNKETLENIVRYTLRNLSKQKQFNNQNISKDGY